jgi:hypothetical protein
MAIKGYVDFVDVEGVAGWVLNEDVPEGEAIVDVFVGNRYAGSAVADIHAPDLYAAGLPRAAQRFKFLHPERLQYADLPAVTVYEHDHHQQLDGNFDQFRAYLASKYNTPETLMPYCVFFDVKADFDSSLEAYKVGVSGDVRIESDSFSDVKFCIPDEISGTTKLGLPTRGRASNFWFYPESNNLGFQFDATIRKPQNDLVRVELTYQDAGKLVTMPVAVTPVGKLADECASLIPESAMIAGHWPDERRLEELRGRRLDQCLAARLDVPEIYGPRPRRVGQDPGLGLRLRPQHVSDRAAGGPENPGLGGRHRSGEYRLVEGAHQ